MPLYPVIVTMTPRQAAAAEALLQRYAGQYAHSRLAYGASERIAAGLINDGWTWNTRNGSWERVAMHPASPVD